jgi:hypothetical protein
MTDHRPPGWWNACLYGSCETCRSPREIHKTVAIADGYESFYWDIVCPNGHHQEDGPQPYSARRPLLSTLDEPAQLGA